MQHHEKWVVFFTVVGLNQTSLLEVQHLHLAPPGHQNKARQRFPDREATVHSLFAKTAELCRLPFPLSCSGQSAVEQQPGGITTSRTRT